MPPRSKPQDENPPAVEAEPTDDTTSRWHLDEAVHGETALDTTDRIPFDFPAGDITVNVGSPDEAVLARVLTQTGHVVPVDDNAKNVALAAPPSPIPPLADIELASDDSTEES